MKILATIALSGTIVLALACSHGSHAPEASTTVSASVSASDAQAYFSAVDSAFRDTINPAAVDPSSPDNAAPIRNALQRLRDIHPPATVKSLHERLIKAGEAYADSIDATNTQVPKGGITGNATELPVGLQRALVDSRRAEADLSDVCIDLEQAAKESGATFSACGGGAGETEQACFDYGDSPLTNATPGPPDGAQLAAESVAGHALPIPHDLPSWVTHARTGRAALRVDSPHSTGAGTPAPSPTAVSSELLDHGAAITFTGDEPGHPGVTITFGPAGPCARTAYAEQRITEGPTTASVRFLVSYGSRSSVTSPQENYVALAASFDTTSGGVVVRLEWDSTNPPDQTEQVAQATDWVKRVLRSE